MAKAAVTDRHYVLDIAFSKTLVCHQTVRMTSCRMSHTDLEEAFPKEANAPVRYGDTLTAFAVTLNTIGAMSINRINSVLSDAFALPVSVGTISPMVKRCAEGLKSTVNTIRSLVTGSPVVNFDETGTRVDGHNKWIHTVVLISTHISATVQNAAGREWKKPVS